MQRIRLLTCALCCCWSCLSVFGVSVLAQGTNQLISVVELKKLSLEQLRDVAVTSVSRSEERASAAPAAVTVVTSDDIRRSGVTTIPEALRSVPGMTVGKATSNVWALGSRGFTGVNSEKLLVQSDTRSIYTPLFSGVLWDVQDDLLNDIDRIEIIRGPGATLWGANAVNGIVNIVTKSAQNTQGLHVQALGGTEEHATVAVRYGGRVGTGGYYRVFAKHADRDSSSSTQSDREDDWRMSHLGFRADWGTATADTFTVQGDAYHANIGQLAPAVQVSGRPQPEGVLRVRAGGGNMLARWQHRRASGNDLQLRVYFDRTHRNDPMFVDDLNTFDVDVQHRYRLARRHELTWGGGYRYMANENTGNGVFNLDPSSSNDTLVSGFVQDQFQIHPAVVVTAGSKLEHNDFSGVEVQPSGRIAWTISRRQAAWAAVSRAVRVPTRIERDIAIDLSDPSASSGFRLLGNPDLEAERLTAYEAGYRWQPIGPLLLDLATFHNRYRGLMSLEVGEPFLEPGSGRGIVPIVNRNLTNGHASGVEVLVAVDPVPWWRVTVSSSTMSMDLEPTGDDLNGGRFMEDSTPRHQLGVRSSFDIGQDVQLDAMMRHVTAIRRIPGIPSASGIPAYAEMDVRLAWRPWRAGEVALVGHNLLHARHVEFTSPGSDATLERAVFASVTWGF